MPKRKAFLLRVDPRLHDAMRRWAEDDFRSLNSQVEIILRRALMEAGRIKPGHETTDDDEGDSTDGEISGGS
ncbi:MAG: hypothetical protein H8E15_03160 [Planctomycetes bacterium]|nr:hypothetical protein [Planctomycetota bacterium]